VAVCAVGVVVPLLVLAGAYPSGPRQGRVEQVWGRQGLKPGRFQTPRAIAIDEQNRLFIVDKTARIQVFSSDGEYLLGWRTPASAAGNPAGLSIDRQGNVLVADTHYYRVLTYTPTGKMLSDRTLGDPEQFGHEPGKFAFVTDAVQDQAGNYFVAECGEFDRIQKISPDGEFLMQWGGHGTEPGQFVRPQSICLDAEGLLWVADACNHRIQVFDARGESARLVRIWGAEGVEPGKMRYPYDLALDGKGHLYVCEFGNHRVQKFTLDGTLVGVWGERGRQRGQLHSPWGLARDNRGRIHVVDSYNQRVQRIRL